MESKNKGDLTINGYGSSNGGEFNQVVINGKGTINNEIVCNEFHCNGSGMIMGDLMSKSGKVSGHAKFAGNIKSTTFSVEGHAKIKKNAEIDRLTVAGHASINGSVKSDEIKVQGRIVIGEDCEAEIFKAESQFTIGGLLNADKINIKLFGECQVQEIGGQNIIIRQKGSSFFAHLLKPFIQNRLETELIEGDYVEIENTHAKIVRGKNVSIGANCKIGLVEYTGTLKQDKKALIEESRKL